MKFTPACQKYVPGGTYRSSVAAPKPTFRERLKMWEEANNILKNIKVCFKWSLAILVILGVIGTVVYLQLHPSNMAKSAATKHLKNQGYSITKIEASRVYWNAGSGCFDKEYAVGAAATHANGKHYEIALCCNADVCKIYSVVEY